MQGRWFDPGVDQTLRDWRLTVLQVISYSISGSIAWPFDLLARVEEPSLSQHLYCVQMSKRPRATSQASMSQPEAFTTSAEPTPKAVRTALPSVSLSSAPFLCTLPPTCNPPHNRPTSLGNSSELESHYAKFHAHVCEDNGCGCVFPDARLLELVSVLYLSYDTRSD